MKRLQDRVVLVFGAGSIGPGWGNGKASAVAYARAGAVVVAIDVNKEAAEEAVDIIQGEGGQASAQTCDVTKEADVKKVVTAAIKLHGRIDILHNNVGQTKMGGPPDLSLDDWKRQLDLNLTGAFLACKYVIPAMIQQQRGWHSAGNLGGRNPASRQKPACCDFERCWYRLQMRLSHSFHKTAL
jgi:NAD(P)-dependent dehydrogenase (short-subunit alcohol dehydrogenase family)